MPGKVDYGVEALKLCPHQSSFFKIILRCRGSTSACETPETPPSESLLERCSCSVEMEWRREYDMVHLLRVQIGVLLVYIL